MRYTDSLPPPARASAAPTARASWAPRSQPYAPARARRAPVGGGTVELRRRLARLNHILIPDKKSDRDRLRDRWIVRVLGAGFGALYHFTRDGRGLVMFAFPVGLASLNVRFSQVHLVFAMLVGVLVGSWLSRPLFRVKGLRVDVRTAPRVAAGAEAHFEVLLLNQGSRPLTNLRVAAPFLPWDGKWSGRVAGVDLLEPGQRRSVKARGTFLARGEHHLDAFEVGAMVSTGLAVGPRIKSPGARFLVVPKVANVTEIRLGLTAPRTRGGAISATARGETDIGGVRPYRIGDPLKHLHARTWARTGRPHVREYLDQRDDRVALLVLVDDPRVGEVVKEAALSLAAGVAARFALHGAGIDTLVIDDRRYAVRPRSGDGALDTVLDRLGTLEIDGSSSDPTGLVREVLNGATSAVIVSVGDGEQWSTLVRDAQVEGLPCRWAVVVEKQTGDVDSATVVTRADIESGKALAL